MSTIRTITLTIVLLVDDSDAAAEVAHLDVDRFLSDNGDWQNWGCWVKNVQRVELPANPEEQADAVWDESNTLVTNAIKEDLGLMPHEEFPKECDYTVRTA